MLLNTNLRLVTPHAGPTLLPVLGRKKSRPPCCTLRLEKLFTRDYSTVEVF